MQITTIPEFDDIIFDDSYAQEKSETPPTEESNEHDVTAIEEDSQDDDFIVVDDNASNETNEENSYGENADQTAIAVFEQLVENGVFDESYKTDFDGTWDKLNDGLKDLPQRVLNTLISQAPDVTKAVVRFAFSSPNITLEELINFNKTYIEEITPVDVNIETMDDARSYLEKVYTDRGMKPRAIEAVLNTMEDDDELLEEAKQELAQELERKKETPKSEQLIADKENEENNRMQAQQQFAAKLSEELDATGWKPNKIAEIKQRFPTLNTLLSEVYKNPKSLIKLNDFLGYYKDGDIDYSKFIEAMESPKARDLKSRLQDVINSPTLSTKSNFKNQNSQSGDGDKAII